MVSKNVCSTRDNTIDALRGFAILLVVLGHCIQYSIVDFDSNMLFNIIYSFHMPLFMFISGYVSYFSNEKIIFNFKKRSILLLVPFFSWGGVNFLELVIKRAYSLQNFDLFCINLLKHPDNNGLWFLWILFIISVITLVLKVLKINLQLGIFCFWILLNLIFVKWNNINFLGLALLKYHLLYYLLGLYFSKTRLIYKSQYNLFAIFCCLFFPFAVIYWSRLFPPQFISNIDAGKLATKALWLFYQYASGIVGIGSSVVFINWIYKYKTLTGLILNKIGLITLEIYAVHFHFFALGFFIFDYFNGYFYISLLFLLVLLSTIFSIKFLKNSSFLSFIFFGQIKQ